MKELVNNFWYVLEVLQNLFKDDKISKVYVRTEPVDAYVFLGSIVINNITYPYNSYKLYQFKNILLLLHLYESSNGEHLVKVFLNVNVKIKGVPIILNRLLNNDLEESIINNFYMINKFKNYLSDINISYEIYYFNKLINSKIIEKNNEFILINKNNNYELNLSKKNSVLIKILDIDDNLLLIKNGVSIVSAYTKNNNAYKKFIMDYLI